MNPAALPPAEAAAYLGVKRTTFYERVVPHIKRVRLGAATVYPIKELDRFLDNMTE